MNPIPTERLTLDTLGMEHPIFWGNFKRGRLISEKHNWLKQSKRPHAYAYLDNTKSGVILNSVNWRQRINQKLYSKYTANKINQKNQGAISSSVVSPSVTSLIWFMRNVIQHFNDYKDEFQGVGVNNVGEAWGTFLCIILIS
jgi:hypothetical protein